MNLPDKTHIEQAFGTIRQEAERRWNTFKEAPVPKISIGMATCGIASGALDTKNAVEEVLAEKSAEKLKEIEDIKTQIKQVEKDIKRLEQLKQDEEKLKELDLWNPEMLIVFKIGSPVELAVHDNKGKLLSKRDGVFVMDKEDMKFAVIFNPQNLENGYNIHVRGTDAGTYSYTMTGIKDKQIVFQDEVKDVPIKEGEAVTFRAKLGQAEVELKDSSSDQEEQEKKAGSFWNLKNIVFVVGVIVVVLIILVIIWFKKRKGKAYL